MDKDIYIKILEQDNLKLVQDVQKAKEKIEALEIDCNTLYDDYNSLYKDFEDLKARHELALRTLEHSEKQLKVVMDNFTERAWMQPAPQTIIINNPKKIKNKKLPANILKKAGKAEENLTQKLIVKQMDEALESITDKWFDKNEDKRHNDERAPF